MLLVKLKDKDKELRDQMKDKDVEVEQLKTKLISEKEEPKNPTPWLKKLERSIMI